MFIRPFLEYGDIIYDQAYIILHQRIVSLQYNAALPTNRAIRGSIREKPLSRIRLGFHDAGIKNYVFLKKSLIVDRTITSPVFSLKEVDFTIPNPANMFQISD